MKAASLKVRTIPSDTMTDVGQFMPMDGLTLESLILGKMWTVIDVIDNEFQGKKTFSVVLQNDEKVINVSAGILKKARILSSDSITVDSEKFYKNNDNILLRSEAENIWNGSRYFHAEKGMKADAEFEIPEQIHIEYAVLRDDPKVAGEALINPIHLDGYRKVITKYQPKSFPTAEDFASELKKEGADRIPGLPVETTPQPLGYVKEGDPQYKVFNLIFKDTTKPEGE